MPLAAPPGPLWSADAKEPHPLRRADDPRQGLRLLIAGEIGRTYEALLGFVPADQWTQVQALSHEAFLTLLMGLARAVDLAKYRKHPRGPKKPKPKRTMHAGQPHVSTAKLLGKKR